MPRERIRSARIEAQIAPEALDIVRRAAEIEGRSVSEFVVGAAEDAARRKIEQTDVIRLSVAGQRAFAEALVEPPKAPAALRKAFANHRRLIREVR